MKTCKFSTEDFVADIKRGMSEEPFEFDGQVWAAAPQTMWAEHYGVDVKTIQRKVKEEPSIHSDSTGVIQGGKKVRLYLLRVGEPGPMTHRKAANFMRSIWDKELQSLCKQQGKPERTHSRDEYGCMIGLAEVWPQGDQVKIFKRVLKDWPRFMSYVKAYIAEANLTLDVKLKDKFLNYPTLATVRRFANVGLQLYVDYLQENQKKPSPALKAATPHLWPKYGLISVNDIPLIMSESSFQCPNHSCPL